MFQLRKPAIMTFPLAVGITQLDMKLMAIQIYYDSCVILTAKGNAMIAGFLSWNMKLMAIHIYYDSCVILTAKRNVMVAGFLSWNMNLQS
jgi:hypothetical protein